VYLYKKHEIHSDEPHSTSWAAMILLTRDLRSSSGETFLIWKKYRKWLLKRARQRQGSLICAYCGKKRLMHDSQFHTKSEYRRLATIDHVIPLSKGGHRFRESNLVISCWPCNQKKGDKVPGPEMAA